MPPIHETEIDGVVTYWADVDGPRVGAIQFGVGRAAEPAAMGGVTHLVEHLALAPLTQQEYPHNGFVTGWRTVIHATGTDEELGSFFTRVTENLSSLPLDRLALERRILRQESNGRDPGTVARLLWYRYGNTGHGQLALGETGLSWVGPEPVQAWANTHFTRQNAAAWFSGPPPANLRFVLPSGPPPPPTSSTLVPGVAWPSHLPWSANGVSLGWIVPRSAEAVVTVSTVAHRAREVLRFERGLVYDVPYDYEPLDGATAHAYVGADSAPEHVALVRDQLLRALEEIAAEGLTDDELRRELRSFRDSLTVPQAGMRFLDSACADRILRRPHQSPLELQAEYEALTRSSTAAALRPALDTLFMGAPGAAPDGLPWRPYPTSSAGAVVGRTVRPAGWPLRNRSRRDRLTIGPDGVTWSAPGGELVTVRYDECVTSIHVTETHRELRGADGFQVRVVADEWQDGAAIVEEIDGRVPAAAVACGEHGIGGLEEPAEAA